MTGDVDRPPRSGAEEGAAEGEGPSRNARREGAASGTAFLRRVATELPRRGSLSDALAPALALSCEAGGWPVARALLRPSPGSAGGETWHPAGSEAYAALQRATRTPRPGEPSDPLLARVIDSPFPAFTADLERDLAPERAEAARAAGLRSLFVVPVRAEDRVAALLEFFSPERRAPRGRREEAVEAVRGPLELLADRDGARRAARDAERRIGRLRAELEPAEARLRELEERYSLLLRGAADGLWDWDLRLDRVGYSPRWKALLGYSAVQIGDRPSEWLDRIHPADRERVDLELREHLEWRTPHLETEHRVLHRDGTYRWVRVRGTALRDEEGRPRRIAGSLSDVTDLRRLEERSVERLLYHPATGLATPALLADRLRLTMARSRRRLDHSFAVLALHLDGLETAKASLGGAAADELHGALARRLRLTTRPGDTVAHGVGRHFTVLLDDLRGARDAVRVAERLEAGLAGPIPLFEEEVRLVPRIGVALGLSRYDEPEGLLRDADRALRRARERQRGIEVFDAEASARPEADGLEADLRAAVERDELHLEYQPILSLDDGRVAGLEAFLRWHHPRRGTVAPERFLSVAREAGLLERMSYRALERACRQLRAWTDRLPPETPPPPVSLNLTARQLFDPELVRRVTGAAKAAEVDPSLLQLDVPESAFVQNPPRALHVLTALRARGLRIAADDFGTGHLSLGALHRLPLSALKVDRSFVSGPLGRERDWDVAATIVELGRMLGMDVVAEGIETREQCLRLREMGCALAQGHYFTGPVAADEAERWIREGHPAAREAPAG